MDEILAGPAPGSEGYEEWLEKVFNRLRKPSDKKKSKEISRKSSKTQEKLSIGRQLYSNNVYERPWQGDDRSKKLYGVTKKAKKTDMKDSKVSLPPKNSTYAKKAIKAPNTKFQTMPRRQPKSSNRSIRKRPRPSRKPGSVLTQSLHGENSKIKSKEETSYKEPSEED